MTASTDVESQAPAARPRGRFMDVFLTVSVIALFVMFVGALAAALLFVKHIENELNSLTAGVPKIPATPSALHGDPSSSTYKMQNFAYLGSTQAELKQGVMKWNPYSYGKGDTIGSLYSFNKNFESLTVNESGVYFLYVLLNFTCRAECKPGQFTVNFYNKSDKRELTCTVSFPSDKYSVSQTCWNAVTLSGKDNSLLAKAEFQDDLKNWELELNSSGFGIFLIDGFSVHHT